MGKNKNYNLVGKVFGRLTVLKYIGQSKDNRRLWLCECSCIDENEVIVNEHALLGNHTKSCGCLLSKKYNQNFKIIIKDNPDSKRILHQWISMLDRCDNPKNKEYHHYGGRGIVVYKDWYHFKKFYTWLMEESNYKIGEKLTLERIDVNGNYEPSNCTWIPRNEQAWNKQNTIRLSDGTPLIVYCNENNINYDRILSRMSRKGITPDEAISMGIDQHRVFLESGELLTNYCKRNNIDIRIIYSRMSKYKLSPDEAINYDPTAKCVRCEDGTLLIDRCKELGLNSNLIRHRVYTQGISIEEALATPLRITNTKAPDGTKLIDYCKKYKL